MAKYQKLIIFKQPIMESKYNYYKTGTLKVLKFVQDKKKISITFKANLGRKETLEEVPQGMIDGNAIAIYKVVTTTRDTEIEETFSTTIKLKNDHSNYGNKHKSGVKIKKDDQVEDEVCVMTVNAGPGFHGKELDCK